MNDLVRFYLDRVAVGPRPCLDECCLAKGAHEAVAAYIERAERIEAAARELAEALQEEDDGPTLGALCAALEAK